MLRLPLVNYAVGGNRKAVGEVSRSVASILWCANLIACVAEAQTVEIGSAPSCPRCTIAVTREVTLGDDDGPGSLESIPISAARDSRGLYYVVAGNAVLVFDSTGRYVRKLGAIGAGPGEFRRPQRVQVGAGDTVYVSDARGISSFSPQGVFMRAAKVAARNGTFVLQPDGSLVAYGALGTSASIGFPFHRFRPDGTPSRSFGSLAPSDARGRPQVPFYLLGRRSATEIWSAEPDYDRGRYTLTAWDSAGGVKRSLSRAPEWMRRGEATSAARPIVAPSPMLQAVRQDGTGKLWTITVVAAPRWRDGYGELKPGTSTLDISTRRLDLMMDTMLEVIDPITGKLVAATRVRGHTLDFVDDSRVLSLQTTEDGLVRGVIHRVRLVIP
jgi:hypothetical protein